MLHTIYTLSIRRYAEVDETENISLLKRWYNPFPVKWFNTDKLFFDVRRLLGENTGATLTNETYKQIAYSTILMLDAMLKTMAILMENQNERSLFRIIFNRKPKDFDGNIKFYSEKVKKMTGIEIKGIDDLKRLQNEIQRRIDKYEERYKRAQPTVSYNFMDIVFGVFNIIGMDYVPEMSIAEFSRLKKKADKIVKKRKENG